MSHKSFVNEGMQQGVGYRARISVQKLKHVLRSSPVSFGTGSSSLVSKFLPFSKKTHETQLINPQTLGDPKHRDIYVATRELLSLALPRSNDSSPRAEIQNLIKKGRRSNLLYTLVSFNLSSIFHSCFHLLDFRTSTVLQPLPSTTHCNHGEQGTSCFSPFFHFVRLR